MKPLHNPYLDAFNEANAERDNPYRKLGWSSRNFERRTELTRMYAWAVPNDEVIYAIAALSPIIELGAGSGYWASLLRQAGAKVRAFDNPSHEAKLYTFDARHNPISPAGPHITARYPDHTLLLCWPPMNTTYDLIALDEHRRAKGTHVVYVGEGDSGCTGSKAFHRLLNQAYNHIDTIYIPQWYGMHDAAYFSERKV